VTVGVDVCVKVVVAVGVSVWVAVALGVAVGVQVAVFVGVGVSVGVAVWVGVAVAVGIQKANLSGSPLDWHAPSVAMSRAAARRSSHGGRL
jgi:threonine/homoserine/homoserine lactone efflux protein